LQRNYIFALNNFKICYKSKPDSILFNSYLGRTYLALKDFERALPFLQNYQSKNKNGNFYLAILFYNLNNFSESINYFKLCPQSFFDKKQFKIAFSASLFNLGSQFYIKNQNDEAKNYFLESIKIYDHAYPSYFQLGMIFLNEENYEESKKYLEAVYGVYKNNDSLKISLAYIYNHTNELEKLKKTISELDQNLFNPSLQSIDFKKVLALTLFRQKKYIEAIPIFLFLYKNNKQDENILFYLAQSRFETGEIDKSINICEIIFKTTKKNISINNYFLMILIKKEDYLGASQKGYDFINDENYNDKTVLLYFYSLIFIKKDFDFKKYYEYLKPHFETNPIFLEAVAYYHLNMNDYNKAILYFYKLHTIIPSDQHTISKLIEICSDMSLNQKVIYYAKKLFLLNNENEKIIFFYAYYLIKEGLFDEAVEIISKVKKERDKAYFLLSEINFKKKDTEKGFFYLKKSFEVNPSYLPLQYKSLIYFYKQKNYYQALRLSKFIEHTNPDYDKVLVYQALLHIKRDRVDLAVKSLEKYLTINKKNQNSYIKFILAACYFKQNFTKRAIKLILHLIKENKTQAPYLVLLALCHKRNYEIKLVSKIEDLLKRKFNESPSYKEYRSKYIAENKNQFTKRNDLGVRIF